MTGEQRETAFTMPAARVGVYPDTRQAQSPHLAGALCLDDPGRQHPEALFGLPERDTVPVDPADCCCLAVELLDLEVFRARRGLPADAVKGIPYAVGPQPREILAARVAAPGAAAFPGTALRQGRTGDRRGIHETRYRRFDEAPGAEHAQRKLRGDTQCARSQHATTRRCPGYVDP